MESKPKIKALVFDAYGTLFDVESVSVLGDEIFPGQGASLSRLWRAKQLEYTWLRSLMDRYEDFWQVTDAALRFAAKTLGLDCNQSIRARLMEEYLRLRPFQEVAAALVQMSVLPLAILSNGSPAMLQAVVSHAGLSKLFVQIISVDEVKVYKPDPRVYELASRKLGVEKAEIGFVSSNCWDAMGAKSFGFTTYWVNRLHLPLDELGFTPDAVLKTLANLPPCLR